MTRNPLCQPPSNIGNLVTDRKTSHMSTYSEQSPLVIHKSCLGKMPSIDGFSISSLNEVVSLVITAQVYFNI